jgi:DNA invertase Pin-like site-specific DNA recombinase
MSDTVGEFERSLILERISAGIARAHANGENIAALAEDYRVGAADPSSGCGRLMRQADAEP